MVGTAGLSRWFFGVVFGWFLVSVLGDFWCDFVLITPQNEVLKGGKNGKNGVTNDAF